MPQVKPKKPPKGLNGYFAEELVRSHGYDGARAKCAGPMLDAVEKQIAHLEDLKAHAYTSSVQAGKPGGCFIAQVFGPNGRSVAEIDTTHDPAEATALAAHIAEYLTRTWRWKA